MQSIVTGQTELNVTLPMVLSEWHKFYNTNMEFAGYLNTKLGGVDWKNWMPGIRVDHLPGALQQRFDTVLTILCSHRYCMLQRTTMSKIKQPELLEKSLTRKSFKSKDSRNVQVK